MIVETGDRIEDADTRAGFEAAILPVAERETAGRLRPIAKLLADRPLPQSIAERHRAAVAERRVTVADVDDGMAEL